MKETETSSQTPEQLLEMLDSEMQQHRQRRAGSSRNRAVFLAIGVLVILMGAAFAFFFLLTMLSDLPRKQQSTTVETTADIH